MKSRIALDAMGGDFLAVPNLQGSVRAITRALEEGDDMKVFLCGPEAELRAAIRKAANDSSTNTDYHYDPKIFERYLADGHLEIVDAPEIVGMDESPSVAIRQKRDSSMARAFHLVKQGKADAAVSAGNSGAMMAYGIAVLGRLPAIKRPAILCHFPATNNQEGGTALLDAGANADCTPQHLEQFAVRGRFTCRQFLIE